MSSPMEKNPDLLSYRELQQLAKRLSLGAGGKKVRPPDRSARPTDARPSESVTPPPPTNSLPSPHLPRSSS